MRNQQRKDAEMKPLDRWRRSGNAYLLAIAVWAGVCAALLL